MTLNSKSRPGRPIKRKSNTTGSKKGMTGVEEKTVAKAYQEIKDGKVRTFKTAEEYFRYLDNA